MGLAKLTAIIAIISPATSLMSVVELRASEWGCQVLLCASASNPSWRAVPACHPPMQRLISAMSDWGFTWPTCPEAGTGKPGYERYAECPAGWSVGYNASDYGTRGEPNRCVQVSDACRSRRGSRQDDCRQTDSMVRPLREAPYYFDIRDKKGPVTRHWFSLQE
jgi:hypothetical protein